jgi:hypothetical protein
VGENSEGLLKKVAARLAEYFRAEGATLKELARSYDVSAATISRLGISGWGDRVGSGHA